MEKSSLNFEAPKIHFYVTKLDFYQVNIDFAVIAKAQEWSMSVQGEVVTSKSARRGFDPAT